LQEDCNGSGAKRSMRAERRRSRPEISLRTVRSALAGAAQCANSHIC
jgi:hypothetical protein